MSYTGNAPHYVKPRALGSEAIHHGEPPTATQRAASEWRWSEHYERLIEMSRTEPERFAQTGLRIETGLYQSLKSKAESCGIDTSPPRGT